MIVTHTLLQVCENGCEGVLCVWMDVQVGVDTHACVCMYLHMCVGLSMCARAHAV